MIPLNHIFRKCIDRFIKHKKKKRPPKVHGQHQTLCQKGKRIRNPKTGNEDIQWKYRDEMCLANNEKQITINEGKNWTTKSRKNQNARKKGNLRILGNIWSGHHQTRGNERKKKKEYLKRTKKKRFKINQHIRNLIKGINTWVVPLVKYSGPFSKYTWEELQEMDQRTRKLMTMHKVLHPTADVDRLYVSRRSELAAFKIASMHPYNDN